MAEKTYKITKKLLGIIKEYNFPCHILTKSTLILRDIDILSSMDSCITMSIIALDESISNIFEKKVPSPKERLQAIQQLSEHGIQAGLAIMPVLPFITEEEIEYIVKSASRYTAQYILHKYLELKGNQKTMFIRTLETSFPHFVEQYEQLYLDSYMPDETYILNMNNIMEKLCSKYNIKNRI